MQHYSLFYILLKVLTPNSQPPIKTKKIYRKTKYLQPFLVFIFCSFLVACQQEPPHQRNYVVGIINPNPNLDDIVESFKQHLTELIRQDGYNISFAQPSISNNKDIDDALTQLKRQKNIKFVFTLTSTATIKAKQAFSDSCLPIIFGPIYDPIRAGVLQRNVDQHCAITGIKIGGSNPKALEWLLKVAPNTKTILVPYNDTYIVEKFSLSDLQKAADKLGVKLLIVKTNSIEELKRALDNLPEEVDALWLLHSTFLVPNEKLYIQSAIKHKIPVASGTSQQDAGIMISYGQNHAKTGRQAARLGYQILKGVNPTDIPVETADFFLGINLHTAKEAGVDIPYKILRQAQEIVRERDTPQ